MFKEIPASYQSLSLRRTIFGVGINDSKYITEIMTEKGREACPFYVKWKNMLERCYSKKYQNKNKSYIGCSVCDEWLIFSNFKNWMSNQDWKGKELDKDIKYSGNKIYSPKNCALISRGINSLLVNEKRSTGKNPRGVSFFKNLNKFRARTVIRGVNLHLGLFDSEDDAEEAYRDARCGEILRHANMPENKCIRDGLIIIASNIKMGIDI